MSFWKLPQPDPNHGFDLELGPLSNFSIAKYYLEDTALQVLLAGGHRRIETWIQG